ncbi:putative mfs multidrug [Diaporthe ampelina]|uniref:Putative mfs multidrug n=1 Tax=Diaporthe ampelina TaxID=1214573 RepID=A0A0G2F5T2_9PEZI|nr:putative mfs multidrug [Diaporthe ampelina]
MTGAEGEERPLLGANRGGDADAVHQRRVIATTFIMVILMDLAGFFLEAPQTKILEGIICSRHYTAATTTTCEPDCTVRPVQSELATVTQMLNTFSRLPGVIVAIPLGILGDRYGRRPVLLTACGLLSELVATPLSALLMSRDPWILYFMHSGLTLLSGTVPPAVSPRDSTKIAN